MALGKSPAEIVASGDYPLLEISPRWERVKLGEIATVQNGAPFSSEYFTHGEGMPLIRIRDVHRDSTENFYSGPYDDEFVVRKGDILIGMDGDFHAAIWKGVDGLLNQRVCRLTLTTKLYSREFLFLALQPYLNAINAETSSVTVKHLSSRTIADIPLPLPPLAEQKRIVAKIEELFSELEAGEESLRVARRQLGVYRQSLLKQAFEGKLTAQWRTQNPAKRESPAFVLERIERERRKLWIDLELEKQRGKASKPDDSWKKRYPAPKTANAQPDFELPEKWVWLSWDQVGLSQNGRAFPSSEYAESGIKLLRPGNLHVSGEVRWTDENTRRMPSNWEQEHPTFVVRGNELVMNLTAQSLADEFLGRVCLTRSDDHCLMNQRIARLRTVVIDQRFALYLLKSHRFRRFVDGLNTGSLIQHMFTSQLAEFAFGMPSLPEQQEIVRLLDEQFEVIERNEREIDAALQRSEALRQAILKKAFTGRLVPQDPSDEPASHLLARLRAERVSTSTSKLKPVLSS